MQSDIADFLSFEIKKEMADRYFGFRKLIEEDKAGLEKEIYYHNRTVGQRIVNDLNRLYIMLQNKELIGQFLQITGLEESVYFDPYILSSKTIRDRVFKGVKTWGLTATGRFKHLFMQSYEQLVIDVNEYRIKYTELVDDQETIEKEIEIFYRQNDLGTIMEFLRSLDAVNTSGPMQGALDTGFSESLEKKMRIYPPAKVSTEIPSIPPLIPLPQIKKKLKKLAEEAFPLHKGGFNLP